MLLPEYHTPDAYIIRTDFSNEEGWTRICDEIRESLNDLETNVCFVEDRQFDKASIGDLLPVLQGNPFYSFAMVIDYDSIASAEFTVMVVDLFEEPGRIFRVTPAAMPSVQANLWLANMDFEDYAGSVDPDGVFRGFEQS